MNKKLSIILEEIESIEKQKHLMKLANAAIRKNKNKGHCSQVYAIKKIGFSLEQALDIVEPDFCGNVGFSCKLLRRMNKNIQRKKIEIQKLKSSLNIDATR